MPAHRFPFHKVHYRRPGAQVVGKPARGPQLAFLSALLVNGLCLALLGWGIARLANAAENAENDLQTANSSFKLYATSAEKPVVPETPAPSSEPVDPAPENRVEVPHPEREAASPPPVSLQPVKNEVPLPPPVSPPVVEAPQGGEPPLLLESVASAAVSLEFEPILVFSSTHAPGDSPMLRNWKTLEMASILAMSLTVTPAVFAGGNGKKDKDKAISELKEEMNEAFKKQHEAFNEALKKFDQNMRGSFKELDEKIEFLKGDHMEQRDVLKKLNGKIKQLEGQVAKLQGDLDQALAKIQTSNRIALSPPATTGRIVLINQYPEELLFRINGKDFRVAPYTNLFLDNQAVGAFTYEVISSTYGLRARNTPQLEPNQTFTITASR